MVDKTKLELAWIGNDKKINVESRISIKNTTLSLLNYLIGSKKILEKMLMDLSICTLKV